jgi:cytochrome P450
MGRPGQAQAGATGPHRLFDPVLDEESQKRADEGTTLVRDYFVDLVAERRRQPLDDLISVLIAIADEDKRLTEDDVVDLAALVFGAAKPPPG